MDAYDITASALTAQRFRLDVISGNLANVNTTRRADGSRGPYLRKNVVFKELLAQTQSGKKGIKQFPLANLKPSSQMEDKGFTMAMGADGTPVFKTGITSQQGPGGGGVEINQIIEDTTTPTKKVYDPSHPDADKDGYVELPNINAVTELVDMISATRAYEANVTAFQSTKAMNKASLDI